MLGRVRGLLRWATGQQNRRYTLSLLLQGGGAVLGLAMQATLAKWVGASDYGVISTVIASTSILGLIGTAGSNGAALRFVPHFEAQDDQQSASRFVGFTLTTTAVASTVLGVAFVAFAMSTGDRLTGIAIAAGAFLVVTSALRLAGTDLARLTGRFLSAYASTLILRPLVTTAGVLAAYFSHARPSVTLAIMLLNAGNVVAIVMQLNSIRQRFGGHALRPTHRPEWLRASPSYVVISAFQLLLSQIDLLAVSVFLSSTSVGYYAAALRTSAVLTLPYVAVDAVIRPRISMLASKSGRQDALHLTTNATAWYAVSTALLSLPMLIWPDLVLRVFGASFGAGRFALQALALGQVLLCFTGPSATLLVYMDRRKVAIVGMLVSAVISGVACGIGAVVGGIDGAAVASGGSGALIGVIFYCLSWRYLGLRVSVVEALLPRLRQRSV